MHNSPVTSRHISRAQTTPQSARKKTAAHESENQRPLDAADLTNDNLSILTDLPINYDKSSSSDDEVGQQDESSSDRYSLEEVIVEDGNASDPVISQTTPEGVEKTAKTIGTEAKLAIHQQGLLAATPPGGARHVGSMLGLGFLGLLIPFGAAGAVGMAGLTGWQAAAAYAATASVVDRVAMNTILQPIPQGSFNPDYLGDWGKALDALPGTLAGVFTGEASQSPIGMADFMKDWGKHFASESITMSPFLVVLYAPGHADAVTNWALKDCLGLALGGAAAFCCVQLGRAVISPGSYQPAMDEKGLKLKENALLSFRQDIVDSIARATTEGAPTDGMQKLLDSTNQDLGATQLALKGKLAVMGHNFCQLFTTTKGVSELAGRFVCLLSSPITAALHGPKMLLPGMVVVGFMFRDEFDKVVKFGLEANLGAMSAIHNAFKKETQDVATTVDLGDSDDESGSGGLQPLPEHLHDTDISVEHNDGTVTINFPPPKQNGENNV